MKYYAQKSSAIRAAKKAGLTNYEIEGSTQGFCIIEAAPIEAATSARQMMDAWIREFQEKIEAAQSESDISNLYMDLNEYSDAGDLSEAVTTKLDEDIGIRAEEIEATQAAIRAPKPATEKVWIRESVAEKPTKLVWVIADSMPGASRKEVQAACVAAGIASGTARTQYQHWFKCRNEAENAPRASIGADGKIIPAATK